MPSPQFEEVYRIASKALELAGEERRAFLEQECGQDGQLTEAVQGFMDRVQAEDDTEYLDDVIEDTRKGWSKLIEGELQPEPTPTGMPDSVGPYRIIRKIGTGGMGIVYEAWQEAPHRKVALKVMNSQMVSKSAKARFEREGEALGRLQHPGIAQVYAVGSGDFGFGEQPYMAMELIGGSPLLEYAHAQGLGRRDRVLLLASVCDAVAHAHERGIIHRDIKPDNVLVDDSGVPKLLDFGIARMEDSLDPEQIQTTQAGHVLGTLGYVAPEQILNALGPVGPAADVFGLGAMGFELLSAQLPRELSGLSMTQAMRNIVREDARRLAKALPGVERDLDVVFAKALENRPQDRFASAEEFAADLRRFANHQPIAAQPMGRLDWTRKWLRRNRALSAGLGATIVSLLLGVTFTTMQANRARKETRKVTAQAAEIDKARKEARAHTYFLEMQSASDAVMSPRGFPRAHELALRWQSVPGEEDLRGWEWRFFEGITAGAPLALAPGEDPRWMSWHPDGQRLAILRGHGISFYQRGTHQPQGSIQFGDQTISSLGLGIEWDPSGQFLSVTATAYALVCDADTGEVIWQIPGDFSPTHRWSEDGKFLWVYGERGTIMKLDASDGSLVAESKKSLFAGNVLVVDSNRGRILSGLDDILILDGETMEVERRIEGHTELITHMDMHPTRDLVATCSYDRSFWVWDLAQGTRVMGRVSSPQPLRHLAFDPTGKYLAVCSEDTTVEIWDWERGVVIKTIPWHTDRVIQAAWSPDGELLASLGGNESVLVYEPTIPVPYHTIDVLESDNDATHISMAWSADGSRALVSDHIMTEEWDVALSERRWKFPGRGGTYLGQDSFFSVFKQDAWRIIEAANLGPLGMQPPSPTRWGSPAASSASGSLLVGRNAKMFWSIRVDEKGGSSLHQSPATGSEHGMLVFPDGQTSLEYDGGSLMTYRDLRTGKIREQKRPQASSTFGGLLDVAISPDGMRIACGYEDTVVRIFHSVTLELLGEWTAHLGRVASVDWSPDGKRLASGSKDFTVKVWHVERGALAASFRTSGVVDMVRWRSDGEALAAISMDRKLHIWDAAFAERSAKLPSKESTDQVEPPAGSEPR